MKGLVVLALVVVGAALPAQTPSGATSMTGVVWDSVTRHPIRGGYVQLTRVDVRESSASPLSRTVLTDDAGRYVIGGLHAGRYAIGFYATALTVLGLESPIVAVQIGQDTNVVVDLAIPGPARVRALRCAESNDSGSAMLGGLVFRTSIGAPLERASVTLVWTDAVQVGRRLEMKRQEAVVLTDEEGVYIACGVPADTPITLMVASAGARGVTGEITLPPTEAVRQDFRLTDVSDSPSSEVLSGLLVNGANGTPIGAGRILLPSLSREVAVREGSFAVSGVPGGTQAFEARALGYEPFAGFVDVGAGDVSANIVRMVPSAQLLNPVVTTGRRNQDAKVLQDIMERGRTSFGTQFLPGSSWLATATKPEDVLAAARGFIGGTARGCGEHGSAGKRPAVRLNGQEYPLGLVELKNDVLMRDILAIETYPDEHSIPLIWRRDNICSLIVVWTKQGRP